MKIRALDESINNKTVIVRVDFNVPLKKVGDFYHVVDNTRLQNARKTIDWLVAQQNKVILISHLGRPTPAHEDEFSLRHLYEYFTYVRWWDKISFCPQTVGKAVRERVNKMAAGEILLLENLRFNGGEEKNSVFFVNELASLADVYVNEAFSSSHRAHASVDGLARKLPAFGGFALIEEVTALENVLNAPRSPLVVVVGGAKISDKVDAVEALAKKADVVLVGGGVANNFIKAQGVETYRSYIQDAPADLSKRGLDYVRIAKDIIEANKFERFLKDDYVPLTKIIYPFDVIAAKNPKSDQTQIIDLHKNMPDTDKDRSLMYLDIGPKTTKLYQEIILQAGTVFWNGPMGIFEKKEFARGTSEVARAVAKTAAVTIVGGGDTITAVRQFEYEGRVDFVSTGGSASLEFLAGEKMPGLVALEQNRKKVRVS